MAADHPSNHFFKFIPPGFKFNLSIPKSFLTKLDGWRSCKKAILRRGRHKWSVHIGDGGVFGDGWRKFMVENGVQEFDFIVFKHQGNMLFDFFVFDPSTCERLYPNLPDDDVQVSLPESVSHHTHKPKKRKRTHYLSPSKDEEVGVDDDRCFVTIMTPYYIRSSRLHVPRIFAKSNGLITKRIHAQVVLVDEAKRSWAATLHIRGTKIHLTGWRELVIKNELKVGDTCKFELVKAGEVPVLNFYNLGKKPVMNHIQVKESSWTKKKATNFFTLTMKLSFRKSGLYLPLEFSISNGLKVGEIILRDDKGRSWKVQLNKHGKNRLYCGRGFRDFWVANGLMEGDAYKFELAENEKHKPPVVNLLYLGNKAVKNLIQ